VQDDIYKLHDRVTSSGEIDNHQWLDELAATYTTQEQHQIHHGKAYKTNKSPKVVERKAAENNSDEITFF
jgi:hypothetical protein